MEEDEAVMAVRAEKMKLMVPSLSEIKEHRRKKRFDMKWYVKNKNKNPALPTLWKKAWINTEH